MCPEALIYAAYGLRRLYPFFSYIAFTRALYIRDIYEYVSLFTCQNVKMFLHYVYSVLTATCLSYGRLCDFLGFFPEPTWRSHPSTDFDAKWLKRRGFTQGTFWNPWPRDGRWHFHFWKFYKFHEFFYKFHEFFEIFQDPLFEIFIEILYFNYNLLIIRKKCQSSLTTAKGQWLEEWRNDTYLYFATYLF